MHDRIKEIIQDEIKKWAIEYAKNKKVAETSKTKAETKEEKALRHQNVDHALFYGFGDQDVIEQSKQRYLREDENRSPEEVDSTTNKPVAITKSEIDKFENDFKNNVSPKSSFQKQSNNEIIYPYNGQSGIEAYASGIIPLTSEDRVVWSFSIQNGANVNVVGELSDDMMQVLDRLHKYYDSWKTEWETKLVS